MPFRMLIATALVCAVSTVQAEEFKVKPVGKGPEGLSPEIAKLLNPVGHQITGPDGAVVDVWLLKSIPVTPGFKPGFSQQYPLSSGQLVGALRIPKGSDYSDFRGQQMTAGTYTLRFGLQPEDGNHVGTSETYDFMLALPAKADTKTAPITNVDDLSEISAKAAGSTHPAIFSLLDPAEASKEATLEQDDFSEHWVLSLTGNGTAKGEKTGLKIRLVVVGLFEG